MAGKIVVLDIHKKNDNRISKHLSAIDGHYEWLRINFNFYPEPQTPISEQSRYWSIDTAPSRGPNVKGIMFLLKYFTGSLIDQIEERLRSSLIEPDDQVIFHVHDPYLLGIAYRLTKRFSYARVIYDRHEYFESWRRGGIVSVPALFEKMYVRHANEVVFVSSDYTAYPKAFEGKHITIIPNYPVLSNFQPLDVDEKISSLLSGGTITFSYFGVLNLNFDRDTSLMLKTMTNLMRRNDRIEFIIAGVLGDIDVLPMIDAMIKEFGNRVKYLGELDYPEMVDRLRGSHFGFMFIRPQSDVWSKDRPLSANKVYEYLVSGTIPIIRAIVDDREDIEDCSLIFGEEDTEEAMRSRITALLKDVDKTRHMILECQNLGVKFTWENVADRYLKCYERAFDSMNLPSNPCGTESDGT